jgi:hypothetical protein
MAKIFLGDRFLPLVSSGGFDQVKGSPPPPYFSLKVFEKKEIGPDFSLDLSGR